MKDNKIYGYAGFYCVLMLVLMLVMFLGIDAMDTADEHLYNSLVEFGIINAFVGQMCVMGLAAGEYYRLYGTEAVGYTAAAFYGICILMIIIQIICMIKMRKGKKIAYRMPLVFNTLDIAFHIIYLINYKTTIFLFAVKLWGEYLLFKAHRTQKKELKRLKEEAKAAAE